MLLSEEQLAGLSDLAIDAAKEAATYIESQAGRALDVGEKEAGSSEASRVVTEVDLESQRLILGRLAEYQGSYDLGLLSEESADDSSRHAKDYFWCIDPLDGTLPFVESVAGYSVSIALVSRSGDPVIGVIADPRQGTIYHSVRGQGCFRDGEPFAIESDQESAERKLTIVTDRSFARHADIEVLMTRLGEIADGQGLSGVEVVQQGGAAMNACWVMEKAPALYFKFPKREPGGGSLWDFAASACLFGEVGGIASDIRGEPLKLNREGSTFMNEDGVVFASSASLADEVYSLFRALS